MTCVSSENICSCCFFFNVTWWQFLQERCFVCRLSDVLLFTRTNVTLLCLKYTLWSLVCFSSFLESVHGWMWWWWCSAFCFGHFRLVVGRLVVSLLEERWGERGSWVLRSRFIPTCLISLCCYLFGNKKENVLFHLVFFRGLFCQMFMDYYALGLHSPVTQWPLPSRIIVWLRLGRVPLSRCDVSLQLARKLQSS